MTHDASTCKFWNGQGACPTCGKPPVQYVPLELRVGVREPQ